MRNLEIKARVTSLAPVRARLRTLRSAARQPVVRQTDSYFRVPKGRLKLRVFGSERRGELICYFRPNRNAARTSDFQVLPVADAAGTLELLEGMFGLLTCVRKRREVWLYQNARIHLDAVAGLGRFVEIEVMVTSGMAQARRQMGELRRALGLRSEGLIAGSYSDMLRKTRGSGLGARR
jgi:predicted adenylyl cyclase CyaB